MTTVSEEKLEDQLNKINQQINETEKQYPFIVTTIVAALGVAATIFTTILKNDLNNVSVKIVNMVVFLFPVLVLLVMAYILQLFRQVALLRGYAAYLEEEINVRSKQAILLWNSKYINGFIQNNGPNILIMIISLLAAFALLGIYVCYFLTKSSIQSVYKIGILIIFLLLLFAEAQQFAKNDFYRRLSYWKAKTENEKIVRVLLFSECKRIIAKSGVGKALSLQMKALECTKVHCTLDKRDFFNIIHINTFGLKSMLIAKKCRKKKIPVVITAHTILEDFKNSFKFTYSPLIQKCFKKWLLKYYSVADLIIAPSEYVKELLQGPEYGISTPIIVVSNGVDVGLFSAGDPQEDKKEIVRFINSKANLSKEKIKISDKIIIGVGLYLERKGIYEFIEIAKKMPQYKFIWFGYTPALYIPKKINRLIRNTKKVPNLIFPGYVDHRLLAKAYKGADVFLMLSKCETEGLVVLEAMASKTQMILNKIPVYDAWIKDMVHCYKIDLKENTLKELKILIEEIINGEKKPTIQKAFQLAKEKDLKKVGQKLAHIYERMIFEDGQDNI